MRTHALLSLACASVAAGCAVAPPDVPEAPPPPVIAPGVCDVTAAQFAVGQSYNTPLAEQMRTRAGAERVRMLQPGDMTTMEFNAARLTIDVDATGKIAAVRCG